MEDIVNRLLDQGHSFRECLPIVTAMTLVFVRHPDVIVTVAVAVVLFLRFQL